MSHRTRNMSAKKFVEPMTLQREGTLQVSAGAVHKWKPESSCDPNPSVVVNLFKVATAFTGWPATLFFECYLI